MKAIISLFLLLFLCSCTTLKVNLADGTKAEYKRYFTGLEVSAFEVTPNKDGSVTVRIEGLKSDVSEAIGFAKEALNKIPK